MERPKGLQSVYAIRNVQRFSKEREYIWINDSCVYTHRPDTTQKE